MNKNAIIIAIANRKGGTGKTTTAVNLAAEWGKKGYKTLLIDLDTQGHAAIGLGCRENRHQDISLHDIFTNPNNKLANVIKKTPVENVSLAAANTEFVSQEIDALYLRNALYNEGLNEQYQRVILDTPPTLDALLINALSASDGVVVPFIPHHLAGIGVRQLAKLFYQVAMRHNTDLRLLGLLPIMHDRHVKLHRRVIEDMRKQFGIKRILRGIRPNIKLAEAFEAGEPVVNYDSRCRGSMDYQLMAEELETLFS